MNALLIRVGIDSSTKSGRWNAPVNPKTYEFAYVPIRETGNEEGKPIRPRFEISYEQFKDPCAKFGKEHELPRRFDDWYAHLDPDFKYLTYGDRNKRGEPLKRLVEGDILAFYAGLKSIKSGQHKPGELIYALIGLYVVDKWRFAVDIPKEDWGKNAHTRKNPDETDIVVFAKKHGASGRLERCIPIGEYRGKFDDVQGEIDKSSKKAYRVTRDLLDKWGRLSVNDGWIQRSAILPSFCDPDKFYKWFQKQNIRLVGENN